ncbi:uncharacterized protein LOC135815149 [Sycon ciliatum]|uniref:uncharacterized protein LOC135815149 n=1 Tax=Sycon ciliatum TaxID=27933 RepID=UPI0031F67529
MKFLSLMDVKTPLRNALAVALFLAVAHAASIAELFDSSLAARSEGYHVRHANTLLGRLSRSSSSSGDDAESRDDANRETSSENDGIDSEDTESDNDNDEADLDEENSADGDAEDGLPSIEEDQSPIEPTLNGEYVSTTDSEGTTQGPMETSGSVAPTAPTACPPSQTCQQEDVLGNGGGELTPSAAYTAVFNIFTPSIFDRSVQILLDEASNPAIAGCGQDFTPFNETMLRVTQIDSPAVIDYFFPEPLVAGQQRTLENARVHFTLPGLGTFGSLQLRFFYDPVGMLDTTQQLIQPPDQADPDVFFPFPIIQTVCTENPAECAVDMPTPPPLIPIPDPLPVPSGNDLATIAVPTAFSAQCIG